MKSEKDKMLEGELYDPFDKSLVDQRNRLRKLQYKFNRLKPGKEKNKKKLLHEMLGKIEGKITIEAPFYCDYGSNIEVGDNFYANYNCTILDVNRVIIGRNCLLAPNVQIYSATHPVEAGKRLAGKELGLPVKIGNNVWIGGGSIICPGVTIGNNVTIGAGSVVTRNIPDDVVAAGNPCRILRQIKSES